MKKCLAVFILAMPLCMLASTDNPKVDRIDPRVIRASLEQRRQWVIEQARGPGAWMFERDYVWVLFAKAIGTEEARRLAYLFFYSTATMGGYFDSPVKEGNRWKFAFHAELGPVEGLPVFVDVEDGLTWQEGQTEKVDMIALIRLFTEERKREERSPNQSPQPTPSSVTPAAEQPARQSAGAAGL
jgi:hypothetical protein